MKYLILSTLMLVFGTLSAQPKVMTMKAFDESGANESTLKTVYPATSDPEMKNGLEALIVKTLEENGLSDFHLMYSAYVNESGAVDYLIYNHHASKKLKDSLQAVVERELPVRLQDWKLENSGGKKLRLTAVISKGRVLMERNVRTGDSLAGSLEAAYAVIDTLSIKNLILDQSDLAEVPYALIYRFPNLEYLDLHGNKLTEINLDMARLPKLENLDLRFNKINQDKIALTKNKSLKILNLQGNILTDTPDAARASKRLESLWLGGNKKLALDNRSFRRLRRVRDLNFYGCDLTTLPNGLRKLRRLEVLDLYYNKFAHLPKPVTKLKRLTHLAVANNELMALPDRIDRLKRLQIIYAHHNHLGHLPERAARLKNLNLLDLGYNLYSEFPKEIAALPNLRELDLSGNQLTSFPPPLSELRYLEKLYLRGNPFLRDETAQAYLPFIKKLEANPTEVFY